MNECAANTLDQETGAVSKGLICESSKGRDSIT